jgi:16S rRNA (cytosine1402-N4)-methyltransferase
MSPHQSPICETAERPSTGGGTAGPRHVSVLPAEVLRLLDPRPGQTWVDCTVGAGGHSRLIAERLASPRREPGESGRLIGLDQDPAMLELARPRLEGLPVTLVRANFDQLPEVLANLGVDAVDGVLADLGFASDQLEQAARGLSFRDEGPLDMRLDPTAGSTAADLVNRLSEEALADIFWEYGEERHSRRVARKIVERRKEKPFATTAELAELVRRSVPRSKASGGRKPPVDPATRVFQALRIAVNDELGALDRLLAALPRVVRPGGRAGVISFHSLEDRRVKHAFRDRAVWEPVTKKPVEAGAEEVARNPRARSAKLRVAVRKSPGEPGA